MGKDIQGAPYQAFLREVISLFRHVLSIGARSVASKHLLNRAGTCSVVSSEGAFSLANLFPTMTHDYVHTTQ